LLILLPMLILTNLLSN